MMANLETPVKSDLWLVGPVGWASDEVQVMVGTMEEAVRDFIDEVKRGATREYIDMERIIEDGILAYPLHLEYEFQVVAPVPFKRVK